MIFSLTILIPVISYLGLTSLIDSKNTKPLQEFILESLQEFFSLQVVSNLRNIIRPGKYHSCPQFSGKSIDTPYILLL